MLLRRLHGFRIRFLRKGQCQRLAELSDVTQQGGVLRVRAQLPEILALESCTVALTAEQYYKHQGASRTLLGKGEQNYLRKFHMLNRNISGLCHPLLLQPVRTQTHVLQLFRYPRTLASMVGYHT
jgi:hypothetical protein